MRNVPSLGGLRPDVRAKAEQLLERFPGVFTVTSVFRSYSEQLQLWLTRSRNPFPVAPPGKSKHQLGLAWDMTGPPDKLREAGRMWRAMGGKWYDSDPIHFEV